MAWQWEVHLPLLPPATAGVSHLLPHCKSVLIWLADRPWKFSQEKMDARNVLHAGQRICGRHSSSRSKVRRGSHCIPFRGLSGNPCPATPWLSNIASGVNHHRVYPILDRLQSLGGSALQRDRLPLSVNRHLWYSSDSPHRYWVYRRSLSNCGSYDIYRAPPHRVWVPHIFGAA